MYNTSRSILAFFEFIAWMSVIAGAILAFVAAGAVGDSSFGRVSNSAIVLAMMPGILCMILGVAIVVFVQMAKASLDTADMTK